MGDIRGDQFRDMADWVQDLVRQVDDLTDRLAAAEAKIGRLLQAAEPEPPRGPYLVNGCVGGTEHNWHTVEQGATFWCPECDAERPARA